MKVKGIFFVGMVFSCITSYAQFFTPIENAFQDETPSLDLKYETRNSFIGSKYARINALRIGVNFDQTFKVGLSYNWLSSRINDSIRIDDQSMVYARYRLMYVASYADWVYYLDDKWKVSILAMVGAGLTHFGYEGENYKSHFLLLYEPYMSAERRVLKYFGIGGGIGFRLALIGDQYTKQRINSPIYVLKAALYLDDLRAALNTKTP